MARLTATYHLDEWQALSGRTDFAASLFYLAMVESALAGAGVALPDRLHALDAGAGDWFYVRALYGLLERFSSASGQRQVLLDGVELDAYSLYKGFRSRRDWAEAYVGELAGVRYLPGDIRRYTQPVDLALMLFPFLFSPDLRRWGLPRRFLRPAELLGHVWSLVKPGGALIVANLGEAERLEQGRLFAEAGLKPVWGEPFASPLFSYSTPRFVWVLRREPEKKG